MDHFSQIANEKTPGKTKIRTPGCPTTNSDSGDTSASEAGQEVASFLTNFPGHLVDDSQGVLIGEEHIWSQNTGPHFPSLFHLQLSQSQP